MIELQQVRVLFNPGQINEVLALKNINLQVKQGQFMVLIGSNGSGKTTLLNTISGSVLPTSGKVFLKDTEVSSLPDFRRSRWIARVFQDPLAGTAPELSILDNFRLAALRTRQKGLRIGITQAFRQRVAEQIARLGLGLENKLQQPMGSLSGGQRQALTLLMSVMDHTDILLLDEPTAALDPRSAEVVMQTAQTLIKEHSLTTILITHHMPDTLSYGDRLLFMQDGKIVQDLEGDAKANLKLEQVYDWFR